MTTSTPAPDSAADTPANDPREEIIYGVLMENGRLAPRSFASRGEAEEWARPEEQVVAWNFVCDCDM